MGDLQQREEQEKIESCLRINVMKRKRIQDQQRRATIRYNELDGTRERANGLYCRQLHPEFSLFDPSSSSFFFLRKIICTASPSSSYSLSFIPLFPALDTLLCSSFWSNNSYFRYIFSLHVSTFFILFSEAEV